MTRMLFPHIAGKQSRLAKGGVAWSLLYKSSEGMHKLGMCVVRAHMSIPTYAC